MPVCGSRGNSFSAQGIPFLGERHTLLWRTNAGLFPLTVLTLTDVSSAPKGVEKPKRSSYMAPEKKYVEIQYYIEGLIQELA